MDIEKCTKNMYKTILASCTTEDIEKINQYIEEDKKRILSQDFNIEIDCGDDNVFVKAYVELYRCIVFDRTVIYQHEDRYYDMYKVAIIISPLYYAEKLVVKKYNELSLAAKQQSHPISDQTEFPKWNSLCDAVPVNAIDELPKAEYIENDPVDVNTEEGLDTVVDKEKTIDIKVEYAKQRYKKDLEEAEFNEGEEK